MRHDDGFPTTTLGRLFLVALIVILCFTIFFAGKAQWREGIETSRYINQRVKSISESTENGDDVVVVHFSNGRYLKIRSRQSRLIFVNR